MKKIKRKKLNKLINEFLLGHTKPLLASGTYTLEDIKRNTMNWCNLHTAIDTLYEEE